MNVYYVQMLLLMVMMMIDDDDYLLNVLDKDYRSFHYSEMLVDDEVSEFVRFVHLAKVEKLLKGWLSVDH